MKRGLAHMTDTYTFYLDISLYGVLVGLVRTPLLSKTATVLATRVARVGHAHHYHKTLLSLKLHAHELMNTLAREYGVSTYDVVFFVRSPLCTSRAIEHTYAFKGETVVTKLHMQQVLESARKQYATKNTDGESSVFREFISETRLNGYATKDPIGKTAHEATCSIVQESLEGGVERSLVNPLKQHARKSLMYNYTQLVGAMINNAFPQAHEQYALCEVTHEALEIFHFDGGREVKKLTVPLGSRRLFEILEKRKGISYEQLHALFMLQARKELTPEVEATLTTYADECAATLKDFMQKQQKDFGLLPKHIFVICDDGTEQFWTRVCGVMCSDTSLIADSITVDPAVLAHQMHNPKHLLYAIYAHLQNAQKAL